MAKWRNGTKDKRQSYKRPSKGFWRQATLIKNVATMFSWFTDNWQKLTEKWRQLATATIHFYFRQSDMFSLSFFRQRRRYQAAWFLREHANKPLQSQQTTVTQLISCFLLSCHDTKFGSCVGASLLLKFSSGAKCESSSLLFLVHSRMTFSGRQIFFHVFFFLWENIRRNPTAS